MANGKDDIRVAVGWPRHPKTLQLIEEAGEAAPYRLLALWCFAGENRPEGVMRSAAEVEIVAGWRGKKGRLHAALVSCGWLEQDGVTLHDWLIEQPWAANRAERSASARASARARWDANRMRNAQTTDANRNAPSPSPSPSPSPLPTPTPSPATAEVLASPSQPQTRNGAHPKPSGPPGWADHGPKPPDSGGALIAGRLREREELVARLRIQPTRTEREEALLTEAEAWLARMRGTTQSQPR